MRLRFATASDFPQVAELICASTNAWYERNRNATIFTAGPASCRLCEIHFAQVRGPFQPFAGVVGPTFMPEPAERQNHEPLSRFSLLACAKPAAHPPHGTTPERP